MSTQTLMGQIDLSWSLLPSIPPSPMQDSQPGLAGPFVGVHQDMFLIAGGANFPGSPPWEGGKKKWWQDGFALQRQPNGEYHWLRHHFQLPQPIAYGLSISTEKGIICIGGNDAQTATNAVYRIAWDLEKEDVQLTKLPDLPESLAMMGGAMIGSDIYVVGGINGEDKVSNRLYRLSLQQLEEGWKECKSLPASPRILPVTAAQDDGSGKKLYVFSGRNPISEHEIEYLTDVWSYDPNSNSWTQHHEIQVPPGKRRCVMAGTALTSGAHHIFIIGGDQGPLLSQEDQPNHPGFGREILSYHTVTDTWTIVDTLQGPMPVTTTAIYWGEDIILPTGEIKPGVRSPQIWRGQLIQDRSFGWVNYAVLSFYLFLLIGIGFFFRSRTKSTQDFFMASRRIPAWAAGLSIFGTQLSAITFMAIPAKTYSTDWRYLTLNLTVVLIAPVVILFFLPFFRRFTLTTAYQYLELRFNLATRLIGSAMFIALQVGRIGIVLFLPALALSLVTGMNISVCILLMGCLSILYTTLGGIEAVIWTDVLQVLVLLGGALGCLFIIPFWLEGDWHSWMQQVQSANKLFTWDVRFDLTTPSFWVVLLGGIASNLISYGSDQTVVQRYLTTKNEAEARKSIWVGCLMAIPATLLFFSIGTALFLFYQQQPQLLDPALTNPDAVFPWFIVQELPPGIAGILISAIFAASMSSLDSSMNSVATVGVSDFFERLTRSSDDQQHLRIARVITILIGIAGTILALLMAGWGIKSFWDQLNAIIGLFTGGLGGLFLLGIFSQKVNGVGACVGLVGSGIIQFLIKQYSDIHVLLYSFTGMISCIFLGYICSLIFSQYSSHKQAFTFRHFKNL